NRKELILLHDKVTSTTVEKLHQLSIEVLPHPPYSLDLSPIDFHIFHLLDNLLTQKRFRKQADIEYAFQQFLSLRNSNFYIRGIDTLAIRWQKCTEHNGNYLK
ncbi:Histone-lysine N-methyltransferase SETMAR, partial [Habropoda laboriosa]